jgi:hypothetical protein
VTSVSPWKEALALVEPRIIKPEDAAALVESVRGRRKFDNCSVVGNDSSMRDSALGRGVIEICEQALDEPSTRICVSVHTDGLKV